MVTKSNIATHNDFQNFTEEHFFSDEYRIAKTCAIASGWKAKDYQKLFKRFILSTQDTTFIKSAKESKGDPFEDIVRYFLEKGGLSREVLSLRSTSKWEIDGHGILNREHITEVWGHDDSYVAGNSFIVECKNYKKPSGADEFTKYQARMTKFRVQLGVFASTSGFAIKNGLGIAEDIHLDFRANKLHLLLTVVDFCRVYSEHIPPLHLLTIALQNARFDKFKTESSVQKQMSAAHCKKVAKMHYASFEIKRSPKIVFFINSHIFLITINNQLFFW